MRKLLLFSLVVFSILLVACAPKAEYTGDVTPEEAAATEEKALAGKAVQAKWDNCVDADNTNPTSQFDKDQLLTKSVTTFGSGSREDRCYTWNKGTPKEKTRLIEGTCKQEGGKSKFMYWYADCNVKFGTGAKCVDGICVKQANGCIKDKEIVLTESETKSFVMDYCTYLINPKGLKYYFGYEDKNLFINIYKDFDGKDQLIKVIKHSPSEIGFAQFENIYSKEWMEINYYDNSKIDITIHAGCYKNYVAEKIDWCDIINDEYDTNKLTVVESDNFKYFVDNSLFASEEIKKKYISTIEKYVGISFNLLKAQLGFTLPIEKIYVFINNAGFESIGVNDYRIFQKYIGPSSVPDKISILELGGGDYPHELVHVFLDETPVERFWGFEEGLAEYMAYSQKKSFWYSCEEDGWKNTKTGFKVPYSDFSVSPDNNAGASNPELLKGSYYSSGECFWRYIRDTYGEDAIQKIVQAWHNTRTQKPPKKQWLIKDIVNPTLGIDLSSLVYERYNYSEK